MSCPTPAVGLNELLALSRVVGQVLRNWNTVTIIAVVVRRIFALAQVYVRVPIINDTGIGWIVIANVAHDAAQARCGTKIGRGRQDDKVISNYVARSECMTWESNFYYGAEAATADDLAEL